MEGSEEKEILDMHSLITLGIESAAINCAVNHPLLNPQRFYALFMAELAYHIYRVAPSNQEAEEVMSRMIAIAKETYLEELNE